VPQVDCCAEEPDPKGAIDLCSSSEDDNLKEVEFRPSVAGISCKQKELHPRARKPSSNY
jgi:hypothetical protein